MLSVGKFLNVNCNSLEGPGNLNPDSWSPGTELMLEEVDEVGRLDRKVGEGS